MEYTVENIFSLSALSAVTVVFCETCVPRHEQIKFASIYVRFTYYRDDLFE